MWAGEPLRETGLNSPACLPASVAGLQHPAGLYSSATKQLIVWALFGWQLIGSDQSLLKSCARKQWLQVKKNLLAATAMAALQGIKTRMARLVDTVNRFFAPKSISFSIQNGIRVADRRGMQLNPNVLSSGEKQLLLLFCNCFHATSRPSIFLIDEPELSLNIAWQRHLLDALTGFSADGGAQFVLATHSLELLAKHRPNTVRLQDVRDVSSP